MLPLANTMCDVTHHQRVLSGPTAMGIVVELHRGRGYSVCVGVGMHMHAHSCTLGINNILCGTKRWPTLKVNFQFTAPDDLKRPQQYIMTDYHNTYHNTGTWDTEKKVSMQEDIYNTRRTT